MKCSKHKFCFRLAKLKSPERECFGKWRCCTARRSLSLALIYSFHNIRTPRRRWLHSLMWSIAVQISSTGCNCLLSNLYSCSMQSGTSYYQISMHWQYTEWLRVWQSLILEENNSAVAAGVNLMLRAETTAAICQLQALSQNGRCKTFDASADGYGRGEGVAALVLKPPGSVTDPVALLHASTVNQVWL